MSDGTRMQGGPAPRFGSLDLLLYIIVVFCWGTSWIGIRLQVGDIAPEVSVFWRFLIAAAVMMAIAAARGDRLAYGRADHLRFALLGLCLFSCNFMLFYHAALAIPSGLLAVVFSLASIINVFLSAALFRQSIEPRVLAGAALGAIGIALLFAPEILRADMSRASAFGLLLSIIATCFFCLGNMVSAASQKRGVAVIPAAAWGMIYGALFCGLIALALGRAFVIDWSARYLGSLVFLALSASVVAFYAYLTLLGRIGAGRAGYATVMFPLVALAISTFAEDYRWGLLPAIGAGLALVGNFVALRR